MSQKHGGLQIVSHAPGSSADRQRSVQRGHSETRKVSGRWLLSALGVTIGAAALCVWCTLCLLFWQGSWELLYHPSAAVTRTPASIGLHFESVRFAVADNGVPRLSGWWIPAEIDGHYRRFTVIYLHDQRGNLSDTVDALAQLHAIGVNILAFDYRGYGQSQFVRPSEAHWREDANSALEYLTDTRHVNPGTIVLDGNGLGANLALEVAAAHASLAGVVVDSPETQPMDAVFNDARARLVPAHLLVRDRYDLDAAAASVLVPVLWIQYIGHDEDSRAYARITAHKMMLELEGRKNANPAVANALGRWLDELPAH